MLLLSKYVTYVHADEYTAADKSICVVYICSSFQSKIIASCQQSSLLLHFNVFIGPKCVVLSLLKNLNTAFQARIKRTVFYVEIGKSRGDAVAAYIFFNAKYNIEIK